MPAPVIVWFRRDLRLGDHPALAAEEIQSVEEGMGLAGIISLTVVAGLLLVGLRSPRMAVAVFLTLIMGLIWTAGFAAAAVGTFNLISVAFAVLFIGITLISIYWIQNNTLFGNLVRTDTQHAVISIFQLAFLLLYLESVGLGVDFKGDRMALAMQSTTLALVGFSSVIAWHHARKNRLLISDTLPDKDARDVHGRIMVEPVSALITLPCAFIGPVVWELAWLVYPLTLVAIRKVKGKSR